MIVLNTHIHKYIIPLILLALVSSQCLADGRYNYLLNKTYAELAPLFDTTVFKKLSHAPKEKFFNEITQIQQLAEKHRDEQLLFEVEISKWYYRDINRLHNSVTESIAELKLLLQETVEKQLDKQAMLVRFEIGGQYFYEAHDYEAAFTQFILNFDNVAKVSSTEMPTKKAIILHTGNVYYNFGDYKNAKKYIQIADTVGNNWRHRVDIQCKNTLGLIYRDNSNFDSAIYYFQQGIDIAKKYESDIWEAILSGNVGICYYEQGAYSKAIPLLQKDIELCFEYGSFDNGVNSSVKLANTFIKTGEFTLANKVIERAWKYVDSMKDHVKYVPGLYDATAKLYLSKGNYKLAHQYRDSANYYNDSLRRRDNIIQLTRVQNRIRQEVHDKEIEALTLEKELITTTRNTLIVILILISIITYLIINRQRLVHHANKAVLTADKKLTESKLQNATEQLDNYTRRLQEKNALIERSASEIKRLQDSIANEIIKEDHNKTLQQLYASTILTDEEWDDFRKLFDKVHTGFLHRLKEKMPELSPADTRFIVLSKLNMTNKEMAGILGVQPDTIRSYKHRLRKKFNISEDANIKDFTDSI